MASPRYATREQVKIACLVNGTAEDAAIDRLIEAAVTSWERMLGRHFYPTIETRLYDWPARDSSALQLVLDADLLDVTALATAGDPIADYFLSPANLGPPYQVIEIDWGSGESFHAGSTPQRQIAVEGIWGYSDDEEISGALNGGIDETVLVLSLSDSSKVGVGDLIHIEDERLVVTEKALEDTTATLSAGVDIQANTLLVPVDDGTKVHQGEIVTVDSERMLIESVAGDNLIVTRAFDGSVLAAHLSGASLYAPRTATVQRAVAGTTAATHADTTAIYRNIAPGLITALIIAETITARDQEKSGYSRTIGQGGGVTELKGMGLNDLRERVKSIYMRMHWREVAI